MFSMQCKFFYDQHFGYKTFKIFKFILKITLLNIINYLINWRRLIFWLMRNTFAAKPFWGFFNTKAFRISRWIWYMYWACLFQKPDIQSVQLKDTKISPPVQVAVVGSRYPPLGAFWLVLSLAWSYSHKHQHQFIHFTQTSGVQHHSPTTGINIYIISLLVNNCLLWKFEWSLIDAQKLHICSKANISYTHCVNFDNIFCSCAFCMKILNEVYNSPNLYEVSTNIQRISEYRA